MLRKKSNTPKPPITWVVYLPIIILTSLYLALRINPDYSWLIWSLLTTALFATTAMLQVILTLLKKYRIQFPWLLLNIGICCLFINLGNRFINREYITIINQSGQEIPELRFSCNGANKEIRKFKTGAKKTIYLQPGKHDLLLLKAELRKGPLVRSHLLKTEGNGVIRPCTIYIDTSLFFVDAPPKCYRFSNDRDEYAKSLTRISGTKGSIAYRKLGPDTSKTILILHGLLNSSRKYQHLAQHSIRQHYQIIIPDLPGFGASDQPLDLDAYSAANQAKALFQLMNSLNIKAFEILVEGTTIPWALELLKLCPECITKISILDNDLPQKGIMPVKNYNNSDLRAKLFVGALTNPLTGSVAHKWLAEYMHADDWQPIVNSNSQAIFNWCCNSENLLASQKDYNEALNKYEGPIIVFKDANQIEEGNAEYINFPDQTEYLLFEDQVDIWNQLAN